MTASGDYSQWLSKYSFRLSHREPNSENFPAGKQWEFQFSVCVGGFKVKAAKRIWSADVVINKV